MVHYPCLTLHQDIIDFGTCFVNEKRQKVLKISNDSKAMLYWNIKIGNFTVNLEKNNINLYFVSIKIFCLLCLRFYFFYETNQPTGFQIDRITTLGIFRTFLFFFFFLDESCSQAARDAFQVNTEDMIKDQQNRVMMIRNDESSSQHSTEVVVEFTAK